MTGRHDPEPLLEARVRLDSLPAAGRTLEVAASEEQRLAIAERLGILSVEGLAARLVARPLRGGIEVSGRLEAEVTQACVVTLDPVPERIAEALFHLFLRGREERPDPAPGTEVFVDVEDEDPPDRFDGPEADLSEWLIETLALALDPYPRRPGAQIDPAYGEEGDETGSPFAALKSLKSSNE